MQVIKTRRDNPISERISLEKAIEEVSSAGGYLISRTGQYSVKDALISGYPVYTSQAGYILATLTDKQVSIRSAIRAFLLTASREEMETELKISLDKGDEFRAACIRELMNDDD